MFKESKISTEYADDTVLILKNKNIQFYYTRVQFLKIPLWLIENGLMDHSLGTSKLDNIRSILVKNGYLKLLIDSRISQKLLDLQQSTKEVPKKCPVYLKLPWVGKNSLKFGKK